MQWKWAYELGPSSGGRAVWKRFSRSAKAQLRQSFPSESEFRMHLLAGNRHALRESPTEVHRKKIFRSDKSTKEIFKETCLVYWKII